MSGGPRFEYITTLCLVSHELQDQEFLERMRSHDPHGVLCIDAIFYDRQNSKELWEPILATEPHYLLVRYHPEATQYLQSHRTQERDTLLISIYRGEKERRALQELGVRKAMLDATDDLNRLFFQLFIKAYTAVNKEQQGIIESGLPAEYLNSFAEEQK